MPAVNRERKHNSNPMGKRKHWYVPCIAPALAALLLAGCGATVDLNEQATAETAMAVQWVPNGSVYATAAEELEYWSTAQKLESALAAILLDEFGDRTIRGGRNQQFHFTLAYRVKRGGDLLLFHGLRTVQFETKNVGPELAAFFQAIDCDAEMVDFQNFHAVLSFPAVSSRNVS